MKRTTKKAHERIKRLNGVGEREWLINGSNGSYLLGKARSSEEVLSEAHEQED